MNIVRTTVGEMSAKEKAECRRLSFRDNGDLCKFITRPDTIVVTVRDDDGKLLGWGAKVKTGFTNGLEYFSAGETGYYVRKTHRRQGIGSKIFYTLNPPRSKKVVFPHDKQSNAFFYALGQIKSDEVKRYGIDPKSVRRKPRKAVMGV